ncbi:MAG: hypothetical protein ACXVPM_20830, partial [Bacteroidia bacterium]
KSSTITSCLRTLPGNLTLRTVLIRSRIVFFSLKTGMTKEEISSALGTPPYDVKFVTDTTCELIYKYRTTDRIIPSIFLKKTNGKKAAGKWVDLFVTYNNKDIATNISSCSGCGDTKINQTKINYAALIQVLEIVAPSVLIYFGLKRTN